MATPQQRRPVVVHFDGTPINMADYIQDGYFVTPDSIGRKRKSKFLYTLSHDGWTYVSPTMRHLVNHILTKTGDRLSCIQLSRVVNDSTVFGQHKGYTAAKIRPSADFNFPEHVHPVWIL